MGRTSTLTVLAMRFSDRPFDMLSLPPKISVPHVTGPSPVLLRLQPGSFRFNPGLMLWEHPAPDVTLRHWRDDAIR